MGGITELSLTFGFTRVVLRNGLRHAPNNTCCFGSNDAKRLKDREHSNNVEDSSPGERTFLEIPTGRPRSPFWWADSQVHAGHAYRHAPQPRTFDLRLTRSERQSFSLNQSIISDQQRSKTCSAQPIVRKVQIQSQEHTYKQVRL